MRKLWQSDQGKTDKSTAGKDSAPARDVQAEPEVKRIKVN